MVTMPHIYYVANDISIEVEYIEDNGVNPEDEVGNLVLKSGYSGDTLVLSEDEYSWDKVVDWLKYNAYLEGAISKDSGIYSVFINSRNVLKIDARGSIWSNIPKKYISGMDKVGFVDTRDIAKFADEEAYDGVEIFNVTDPGGAAYGFKGDVDGNIFISLNDRSDIKSAVENIGDFSANNNDIRFQIIGERGAANLDRANEDNVRMQDLSVAKEMEAAGRDSKEIWTATGWERGADGQWRYEIPDLGQLDLKPIDLANESVNGKIWVDNELTLGELFHDNDLFKAYPELKDIKLGFVYFDNVNLHGVFDSESKTIYLSKKVLGETVAHSEEDAKALKENDAKNKEVFKQGVKAFLEHLNKTKDIAARGREVFNIIFSESTSKTLAHEIQHAIQDIEGFAKGGNWLAFRDITAKDHANKLAKEANNIFDKQSEDWKNKVRAINRARIDQDFDLVETLESELEDDAAYKEYSDLKFEASLFMEDPDEIITTAFEQYHRLAGEVEARNAGSRLKLSKQERAETPLSETEDVSRKNQGVIWRMEDQKHLKHMKSLEVFHL